MDREQGSEPRPAAKATRDLPSLWSAIKRMTTRDDAIIEFANWLLSPPGRYLLDWEQSHIDHAVADLFGFHALQLGLPQLDALRRDRRASTHTSSARARWGLWERSRRGR